MKNQPQFEVDVHWNMPLDVLAAVLFAIGSIMVLCEYFDEQKKEHERKKLLTVSRFFRPS
jgi:hypothetical protein